MRAIQVLLVEDNPADAELTKDTLEQSKLHIGISVAKDGVEALEQLSGTGPPGSASLPDLVLLDLNLPKLDGREVLAAMKTNDTLRPIPVVILSSSDAEQDIARSYALGANCYVTKPVGLVQFREIVRSVENFWFTVVKLP